jgi:proteasome lid subunit RPN8/RPN11
MWAEALRELNARGPGSGRIESGAFLLGKRHGLRREVKRFAFYDDLDPECLDTGSVLFRSSGYAALWQLCSALDLEAVADVHTHPGAGRQSSIDSNHPMIPSKGHMALIVPDLAAQPVGAPAVGVYEYLGSHQWRLAPRALYIGRFG